MNTASVPTEDEEALAAPISASNIYASELASREEEQLGKVYDTPWLLPKHKIFISHSGRQKDFAEQLCEDLETHGYYPFFDKRSDSLPKGEKFPPLIFKAARECLLAIVLVSEDFFTRTKWPMLELAEFVKAQKTRKDLHILPVLLGLTTEDVRNTAKWSESWIQWGKQDPRLTHNVIVEWEAAVQSLRSWNMILKVSYDGEVKLRKGIVEAIIKTMPPDIRSDVLHVQGRERLCKEVCSMFDRGPPPASRICENATILGVYGIGGAGKSTLCMIITEYLRSKFSGRVCTVELGTEAPTVNLHRQVLRQLCRDDPDFLNKHINTEREGLNRLNERICREQVFLAIDNVSDDVASISTARSFLRLKFHPNSMVLVTSRSDEVLCRSLGIPVQSCMCCLSTTKEEALQLLLEQVNLPVEVLDEDQMQVLHEAVELSDFKGYHPLALQLFAAQLGTDQFKWREIKLDLEWTSDREHPLFSKIETNYLRLPDRHTKDIFMDIALFTPEGLCGVDDIICWLTDTISLDAELIRKKLGILRVKSLLEIWKVEDETFRIHDLYRVLAQRNASADTVSPRFIYQKGGIAAPKVLLDSGQNIERATFVDAEFEMLGLEACTNLKALSTRRCEKLRALCIQRLSYLVSLEVTACALESLVLSGLSNLRWLHIVSCKDLMQLDSSEVEQLRHVNVSKCSKLTDLDFKNCSMVKSVSFMYNDKLSNVKLGNGRSLECLTLWFCESLVNVEISGVAYLTTLNKIDASVWSARIRSSLDMAETLSKKLTLWIKLMVVLTLTGPESPRLIEDWKRRVKRTSLSLRDELNFLLRAQVYSRNGGAELKGVRERAGLTDLWKVLRDFMTRYEHLMLVAALQETLQELKDLQELLKAVQDAFKVPYSREADEKDLHNIGKLSDLIGELAGGYCSEARSEYVSFHGSFSVATTSEYVSKLNDLIEVAGRYCGYVSNEGRLPSLSLYFRRMWDDALGRVHTRYSYQLNITDATAPKSGAVRFVRASFQTANQRFTCDHKTAQLCI